MSAEGRSKGVSYHLAEPDHDARRFASANCGLLGLRSFRCGALGTIDALTATSRNVARPNVHCPEQMSSGLSSKADIAQCCRHVSKGWEQTFRALRAVL